MPEQVEDQSVARHVWGALGVTPNPDTTRQPWLILLGSSLPEQVRIDVALLLLWQIWKARNALIFDRISSTPSDILRKAVKDIDGWSCRYNSLRPHLAAWKIFFDELLLSLSSSPHFF